MKSSFSWDVVPCHWVSGVWCFTKVYWSHFKGPNIHIFSKCWTPINQCCGIISQKNGDLNCTTTKVIEILSLKQIFSGYFHILHSLNSWTFICFRDLSNGNVLSNSHCARVWVGSKPLSMSHRKWLWFHNHIKLNLIQAYIILQKLSITEYIILTDIYKLITCIFRSGLNRGKEPLGHICLD